MPPQIEILVLRHQLAVLRRQVRRPVYWRCDRALLAAASRILPGERWGAFLVRPETLLRWHRSLVARKWARPHHPPGRLAIDPEVRRLILSMAREWSQPPIFLTTRHPNQAWVWDPCRTDPPERVPTPVPLPPQGLVPPITTARDRSRRSQTGLSRVTERGATQSPPSPQETDCQICSGGIRLDLRAQGGPGSSPTCRPRPSATPPATSQESSGRPAP